MTDARPTPDEIDDLCIQYDNARLQKETAEQYLSEAKGELLAMVQAFGQTPAHAEKTMRLEGRLYVASATAATTVEMDDARVEELQSELSRLRMPRTFRLLFQKRVKYSPVKDAGDILKIGIGGLPEGAQNRLLGIFGACFKVNQKAPSLAVEQVEALRRKEEAAAKKRQRKGNSKGSGGTNENT
jgi:hypothetical protein